MWESYYGWTWVGDEPWGYAPYHYGNWFYASNRWCWYPGAYTYAPVYRPALVGFFSFGFGGGGFSIGFGNIGWVPLAPYEAFHPWWGPGYGYGRTTIVNNITNIRNVTIVNNYRNFRAPNSAAAVSNANFANGDFKHVVSLHETELKTATPVRGVLPVVPTQHNLVLNPRAATPISSNAALSNRFANFHNANAANAHAPSFATQRETVATAAQKLYPEHAAAIARPENRAPRARPLRRNGTTSASERNATASERNVTASERTRTGSERNATASERNAAANSGTATPSERGLNDGASRGTATTTERPAAADSGTAAARNATRDPWSRFGETGPNASGGRAADDARSPGSTTPATERQASPATERQSSPATERQTSPATENATRPSATSDVSNPWHRFANGGSGASAGTRSNANAAAGGAQGRAASTARSTYGGGAYGGGAYGGGTNGSGTGSRTYGAGSYENRTSAGAGAASAGSSTGAYGGRSATRGSYGGSYGAGAYGGGSSGGRRYGGAPAGGSSAGSYHAPASTYHAPPASGGGGGGHAAAPSGGGPAHDTKHGH